MYLVFCICNVQHDMQQCFLRQQQRCMWCSFKLCVCSMSRWSTRAESYSMSSLPCLYAGACNSTGAMHPGAYHIAHGQGTGTLAKQQSLVLSFSPGSLVTLRCHNKGAAHVTAAKSTHHVQYPAAIGLQLRQVAVQAVVKPDIGSELDPLAGEQCLLVCEEQTFHCVHQSKSCFMARWLLQAELGRARCGAFHHPVSVLANHNRLPSIHLTLLLYLEALLGHQL